MRTTSITNGAARLSRYACGRILLHIAAMFGDGQVRWHCAGIAREAILMSGKAA